MRSEFEERVKALRQSMEQIEGGPIEAYFVPRADVHQGEEVPPCDERLAWLTGFTGSAGHAFITQEQAYVFVDGRYTLQVAKQCPTPFFTAKDSTVPTDPGLLTQARLGYDPWLVTPSQLEGLKRSYPEATLVGLSVNLIDAIWKDRPHDQKSLIRIHSLSLAGQSSFAKRQSLAKDLAEAGLDAQVLTAPDAIAWLLNVRGQDLKHSPVVRSFAVLHRDATCDWFVESERFSDALKSTGLRQKDPDSFAAWLQDFEGSLGIDPKTAPVILFDLVSNPKASLDPITRPKARKNAAEIAGIRLAHQKDARALRRFVDWLKPAVSSGQIRELEVAKRLYEERTQEEGFLSESFETIAGAGSNGAIVHYRATAESNADLKLGQAFLLDSGGQYLEGTTDITRTFFFGDLDPTCPDQARFRLAYTLVLKGHIALARARFPKGTTGAALDVLARQFLWAENMDYQHGTGHGVGACLNVHEGPASFAKPSARSMVALEPGMFLSNEPGYYEEGKFGVRLENLMVVRLCDWMSDDEEAFYYFEILSFFPFEEDLIDQSLLTVVEKAWLDDYHRRCQAVPD